MSSVFHGIVVEIPSWAHKCKYIPLTRTEQFISKQISAVVSLTERVAS